MEQLPVDRRGLMAGCRHSVLPEAGNRDPAASCRSVRCVTPVPGPRISNMPPTPLVTGPTAERVAENLARIRAERRLSTRALSDALSQLGRPILANAITKIEKGTRRVDADDLVALALALDVSPNALLFPPVGDIDEIELTPGAPVSAFDAWRWATGEVPLDADVASAIGDQHRADPNLYPERRQAFRRENRPHDLSEEPSLRWALEHAEVLADVERAITAARAEGLSTKEIFAFVELLKRPGRQASDAGGTTGNPTSTAPRPA